MFIIKLISEDPPSTVRVSLPKGTREKKASLKHCIPQGIPIIVQQSATPPTRYPITIKIPPKSNQNILPSIDIILPHTESIIFIFKFHTDSTVANIYRKFNKLGIFVFDHVAFKQY